MVGEPAASPVTLHSCSALLSVSLLPVQLCRWEVETPLQGWLQHQECVLSLTTTVEKSLFLLNTLWLMFSFSLVGRFVCLF